MLLKIKTGLLAALLSGSVSSLAQTHIGYHSDNYAGIHNIAFQPADIVDSRYVVDINLIGSTFAFGNDYLGVNSKVLTNFDSFKDSNFGSKYVTERLNGQQKNVYLSANALLPSFAFNVGKHAFAFQSNFHTIVNAEGINEKVAYAAYRELETPELWKKPYENKNQAIQAMGWIDYGLSYGHEVYNKGEHYVKAAGTLKLLQGLYSAQLYSKNAKVTFVNDDTLNINDTDFSYGHSSNFKQSLEGLEYKFVGLPTVGADIGVVYEWRRKADTYTYSMDGKDDWLYDDRNKYRLKVSAAVCNIGAIPFTKGAGSTSFYANKNGIAVKDFTARSVGQFDSTLYRNFTIKDDAGSIYYQSLPLSINLGVDVNLYKGLYLNGTAAISPLKEIDPAKTHHISTYSITPRFEHRWFGIWLPVSYDALNNMHVGTGMRLGPLVLGIQDVLPYLMEKQVYDLGAYAMLRIPIFKNHKHDTDGDKVSNRKDKCPKEFGLLANNGCPEAKAPIDRDGDGVTDADDKCPDVKGLTVLKGCPDGDKDGDGVLDLADKCPTVKGTLALMGCPEPLPVVTDKDGDGILDKDDKCPDERGIVELKGCPDVDKDGDGIVDRLDKCPKEKGIVELQGCPDIDKDKDGIVDRFDKCPTVKGVKELEGCPDKDSDKDGIVDRLDECPDVKGFADTKGCPHLEKEEEEIIKTAFTNLEFKRGSDQITPTSYVSLYQLAALLVKKPSYTLEVKGHTDNVGKPELNLALSIRRAEAVKKYLTTKDVKAERITTQGFGDTKPLNENKTEEERAKNRRVELIVKAH